jgi:hypothetical protein
MIQDRNPTESNDKGEVAASTDFDIGTTTAMERFKSLARRIVRIPKEEIKDIEHKKIEG